MIAVPREDGGVAVHGSLQCPYYIHKAMKRALRLNDEQAQVVQAETGGGFGGKEEYPSIIALHAALLARKTGKPVRMIYDRHEDLSATTKRHPAIVTHRTGVKPDGTLVAQDIEVVMDGGAYCTLTPVVLSRGAIHAGGPYRCPNVRIRARATRTNTPPNGAFRGFGAPQVEFAAEIQLDRLAERLGHQPARDPPPEPLPASATRRRPARSCARASPRQRSSSERPRRPSSRASGRGRRAPAPAATGSGVVPGVGAPDGSRPDGVGDRGRPRLARRRLHRLRRGQARERRLGRARRRRPGPDPDRLDGDGAGDEDDLPAARRRGAGRRRTTTSRSRRRTPRSCPTPARRSRAGRRWSSAGC